MSTNMRQLIRKEAKMNSNETWFVKKNYGLDSYDLFTPVAVIAAPRNWEGSKFESEVIKKVNLIAAAPQMLDVLKDIFELLSEGSINDIVDYDELIQETIALAEKDTF